MTTNLVITIMAAGEGKRMNSDIPKVLHLFKDDPMLVRIIKVAKELNPKKILVITGKYDDIIQKTLSQYLHIDDIYFIKQSIPNGTGDAIKHCLPFYGLNEKVLILNGDMPLINKSVLYNFIEKNENNKFALLVAQFENPQGYGRIIYSDCKNGDDCIKIVEEKDCADIERDIKIINSGLYYIDESLLQLYIPRIQNNNSQGEFYLTDMVKLVKENTNIKIHTHLIEESENIYICGVNTRVELQYLENI